MSSEAGLLGLYRARLLRRELSLLTAYYRQGRSPRIAHLAYRRASFVPLVVPLIFFALRGIGLPETGAAIVAFSAFLGLVLADMQLFVMNAGNWIFAKQALNWQRVADISRAITGQGLDTTQAPASNRWDQVQISSAYRQSMAKTYLNMRKGPPELSQLLTQSPEARTLLISTAIVLAVLAFNITLLGLTLAIYFFVIAWPAKRLKAALDFRLTWPVLRDAFKWDEIERLAGRSP